MGFTKTIKSLFNWTTVEDNGGLPNIDFKQREDSIVAIRNATIETQTELKAIIQQVDEVKDFYMSQMIIQRIFDDALNPSADTNSLFTLSVVDSEGIINDRITKEANIFKKEFNIEKLITDISPDIIAYGFYYIRLDVNSSTQDSRGIINIHDDVSPERIVPIFRDNEIAYFNVISSSGEIVQEPAHKYVFFNYGQKRKKVKTTLNDTDAIYFRIGQGVLAPVISQLKNLYLLEGMMYVNIIKKALKQPILTVSVPDKTKPEEAINIAKTYEKLVNKNMNGVEIDFNNVKKTLDDVLESSGKLKVIPGWGDKGSIEKTDFEDFESLSDIKEKIDDLRTTILKTEGINEDILANGMTRIEHIQQSVRYAKKVKTFQNSLKHSIKQLFLVHLQNNGYNIHKENINVEFNGVIDLNDLEKIEYLNMSLELLDGVNSFIVDVRDSTDETNIKVDNELLTKFYNKTFSKILGKDIFSYDNPDAETKDSESMDFNDEEEDFESTDYGGNSPEDKPDTENKPDTEETKEEE